MAFYADSFLRINPLNGRRGAFSTGACTWGRHADSNPRFERVSICQVTDFD
jgi:hypothetical protein